MRISYNQIRLRCHEDMDGRGRCDTRSATDDKIPSSEE